MKVIIAADSQSLNQFPEKKKTLLEESYQMFADKYSDEKIIIQCTADIFNDVKELLPESQIFTEPAKRGTAPALGLAATRLLKKGDDEVFTIAYSDHPVSFQEKLTETLNTAAQINKSSNKIILLGVNPTYPETKYGYAKIGRALQSTSGTITFEMVDFVEKPPANQAKKFLETWNYLWNTGYVILTPKQLLSAYKETMPDLYQGLMTIKQSLGTKIEDEIIKTVFNKLDKISIDKGLFERIENTEVNVIPVDLNIKNFTDF